MTGMRLPLPWRRYKDLAHPIPTRRELWKGLLVAAALWACVQIGINISRFSVGYKVGLLLGVALLVGLIWGPFGYLCLLVTLSPYKWVIPFNVSRIPVLGWVLAGIVPGTSLQVRTVLVVGGGYLGVLLLKSLQERTRWHTMPFVPLGVMVAYGALVASIFAWFAGEREIVWYSQTILYGAVVFLLVYSLARTPRQLQTIVACMIAAGFLFSVAVLSFPPSVLGYVSCGGGRLGGYWTLPLGVGIWVGPAYISSYFALSLVLAWGELLAARAMWMRGLLLVTLGVVTRGLLMTVGRTGIYGAAMGTVVLTMIYSFSEALASSDRAGGSQRRSLLGRLGFRAGLTLVLFGMVLIFSIWQFNLYAQSVQDINYWIQRVTDPVTVVTGTRSRREFFMASLRASVAYPEGIGNLALPSIVANQHSLYTLMLAGLGWVGFAGFIGLWGWCTMQCIRGIRATDPPRRHLSMTLLGGLVTVFVMGFGHPFVGPLWGTTLFWTLLGLTAALTRLTRNGSSGGL